ncbi:hypothetical protein [Pseudoalteromonas sp. Of7M-16]|nr:hypothetical protein [Pseudoalteromonas sp. Of7M-16]MCG7548566.1 hypothetical protein [Pseudoalteromonas sp. Of7M-16]
MNLQSTVKFNPAHVFGGGTYKPGRPSEQQQKAAVIPEIVKVVPAP